MVKLPFLFVAEGFVSFVYFQELLVVRRVWVFIGVKLVGQLVIRLFYVFLRRVFRDAQYFIIILQNKKVKRWPGAQGIRRKVSKLNKPAIVITIRRTFPRFLKQKFRAIWRRKASGKGSDQVVGFAVFAGQVLVPPFGHVAA